MLPTTYRHVGPSAWPELPLAQWQGTKDALHLWIQIVGKVRLALEPMINQWWQVPFYVSARGLTTSLMHLGERGLEIEFNFQDHRLDLWTTGGSYAFVALEARSVAEFFRATIAALADLDISVPILGRPVEMETAVPFAEDVKVRPYDAEAAHKFWLLLVEVSRVMTIFRSRFQGKASPVHFFWGAADLAVTRFSGRRAPKHPGGAPNCADWVQELAYSHEVSSCGYWPGGSEEGSFYAYAYPVPDGFSTWPVIPEGAYFDSTLGEFILPYSQVRKSDDPDGMLLTFFQSTYEAEAELANWDREALEVTPPS